MICKECGAIFDEKEAKCPFCGALNYTGAESEYMEHLMDIKENLSEMSDDSSETYHSTLKKSTLIIIITLSILLIVGILIASIIGVYSAHSSQSSAKLQKAQMLWREQYADEYNQMYEDGDYDGILAFFDEHASDEGFSAYSLEHCDFIMLYSTYVQFQELVDDVNTDNLNELTWCLYYAALVDYSATQDFFSYTDEEKELISGWQEETAAFYHDTLGLSDDEIAEMKEFISNDDSIQTPSSKNCKKYLQQHFE